MHRNCMLYIAKLPEINYTTLWPIIADGDNALLLKLILVLVMSDVVC